MSQQRIYQEEKVRLEAQKTIKAKASLKETCLGCGCLLALSVVVLLVIAAVVGNPIKNHNDIKKPQTAKSGSKRPSKQTHQSSDHTQAAPVPKPDLEVLNYRDESDEFAGYVVGSIRNNTDHSYQYVQVEINLYDRDGDQVGSTLANVDNLAAKGV